jgi:hypothetical protein
MSGRIAKGAIGSAHFICQMALIASPAKAMNEDRTRHNRVQHVVTFLGNE